MSDSYIGKRLLRYKEAGLHTCVCVCMRVCVVCVLYVLCVYTCACVYLCMSMEIHFELAQLSTYIQPVECRWWPKYVFQD